MRQRILIAAIMVASLSSWVNNSDRKQVKPKDSLQKTTTMVQSKKQAPKKNGMLLFESLLHHLF